MLKVSSKYYLILLMLLSGCAHNALNADGEVYDPWESVNRKIFAFNEQVDKAVIKPVATVYDRITPSIVQRGVHNVFGNIEDIVAVFNSLLQFKFKQAASGFARVIDNTIYGLGGLIDVGTGRGHPKIHADFGSTMAYYGFKSGPYMVWPILGPSTVRHSIGTAFDTVIIDPPNFVSRQHIYWQPFALQGVAFRADLLDAEHAMQGAMMDKYNMVRDSWLQHRQAIADPALYEHMQQQMMDDIFDDGQKTP